VRAVVLITLFVAISMLAPRWAMASAPVKKTLDGCVAGGTFYSIALDARTGKPVKAYPMRIEGGPDLASYEGKKLSMSGLLYPGDRFLLDKGSRALEKGTCGADERAVIQKELIMAYRVAGYKAAQKKEFDEALRLANVALAMDTNLCGTYIDRALTYNLKGDFAAGAADIKRVTDGACVDPQGLNFLMLDELGATLEKAGKKSDAIDLYYMGLHSCESDMCREAMETSLRRAMGK
jgi:tetratricopeptide (TPR) repeat protein